MVRPHAYGSSGVGDECFLGWLYHDLRGQGRYPVYGGVAAVLACFSGYIE